MICCAIAYSPTMDGFDDPRRASASRHLAKRCIPPSDLPPRTPRLPSCGRPLASPSPSRSSWSGGSGSRNSVHRGARSRRHYRVTALSGQLDGVSCWAVTLPDDTVAPEPMHLAGLRSLFLHAARSRCSQSPRAHSRSSNGTGRTGSAGAAARRRATRMASAPRSARAADTSRIRGSRRR